MHHTLLLMHGIARDHNPRATAFCSLSVCLRCPSTLILGTGLAGPTPLDFLTRVPAPLLDRVPDFEFFH